jgi:hypothetical protein
MRIRSGWWAAGLLIAAAAAPARSADPKSAAPPLLTLEKMENMGFARFPGWVKFGLTLRTFGEPFRGRIHIRASGDFGVAVDVPAASAKSFTVPVLFEHPGGKLLAGIEDASGEPVGDALELPNPVPLKPGDILVALAAEERRRDWTDPSLSLPQARLVVLPPRDLPQSSADLEAFDLMIFPGKPPANPDVRKALVEWVEAGGVLFIPDPRLFEGTDRKAAFEWLFPGFRQDGSVPADALLRKWGVYDHRTVFLEALGVRKFARSPLGDGWVVALDLGAGAIAFPTQLPTVPKADPKFEEKAREFWETVFAGLAGFQERTPPNPRRPSEQVSLVEPKLYRFFQTAQWPDDVLYRARVGILAYAGAAVLVLAVCLVFFYRSWQHLLAGLCICVLGSWALLWGFTPSKTAVGETLGFVRVQSGSSAPSHWRLFHVASFTGSHVDCSLGVRPGERIYQVGYSQEDRHRSSVKWNFGDRVEIRGIRLEEGGRFLALGVGSDPEIGTLSARWESPVSVVIKNEMRPDLVRCALIRDGLFLPLKDFHFGDAPRTVDLAGEWIPIARFVQEIRSAQAATETRVIRAFFDEYFAPGETVFTAFLTKKNQDFQSRDLLLRDAGLHLVAMTLPPAPGQSPGK